MNARRPYAKFVLERSLGRGALGEAFLARTPWVGTPIAAVKIFAAARAAPASTEGLQHPNVVTAFESGVAEGRRWIASELVLGKSLAVVLERAAEAGRAVPPSFAVRLWVDLLAALAWLEKQERPHGAISARNILVTYAGAAKLADVGEVRDGAPPDLAGVAAAIAPLLEDHPALAPLLSHAGGSARDALDALLLLAVDGDAPAPRVVVGRWISELFAAEKASELAELESLKTEEELRAFEEVFDGETARSFMQEETIEEVTNEEELSLIMPLLMEPPPLEAANGRKPNVPTLVLFDEESAPKIAPRPKPAEQLGRYRIIERLGGGGMAEIHRAEDTIGGGSRSCVIKRIVPALRSNSDFTAMFEEEGRIARLLEHPNIVECFDSGTIDGVPFIAFELIEGIDLANLIASLEPERLPPKYALEIGAAIARALDHAHPLQLVHRDISPENVLISWRGQVKLLDFGISKFRGRSPDLTRAGVIKGKLGYLSPEQIAEREVDARSDLYQLGVVLTEALSGRRLFGVEAPRPRDLESMRSLIERHLMVAGALPGAPIDLLAHLCAPDPDQRPPTAKHALARIEEAYARTPPAPAFRRLVARFAPATFEDSMDEEPDRTLVPPARPAKRPSELGWAVFGMVLLTCAVAWLVYAWLAR